MTPFDPRMRKPWQLTQPMSAPTQMPGNAPPMAAGLRSPISPELAEFVQRNGGTAAGSPRAAAFPKRPSVAAPITDPSVPQAYDPERAPIAQGEDPAPPEPVRRRRGGLFGEIGNFFTGNWGESGQERQRRYDAEDAANLKKHEEQLRSDPNSKVSQRARARASSFLEASGMAPEEIAQLSAADLDSFDPVKAAQFRMSLQAKSTSQARALSNDPASPESERARQQAAQMGIDPATVAGMSEEDIVKDWKGALQARAGQENQHGRVLERMAEADRLARGRMGLGDTLQRGRQEYGQELQEGGQIAKEERERGRSVEKAQRRIPGVRVTDEEVATGALQDDVVRRDLQKAAGSYSTLISNMDKLERLRAEHGVEVLSGAASSEYNAALTLAIGALTELAATGVLNGGEFERYKAMIPDLSPKLSDAQLVAGHDPTLQQIRGARRAIGDAVNSKLRPLGVEFETPAQEALRMAEEEVMQKPPKSSKVPPKPKTAAPPTGQPRVFSDDELEEVR